jgi:hypothetical protein
MIPPPPIYTPAQSRIVLYIVFLYIETLYLLIYIIYMENVFKKARADRLFVSSLSFVSVFMMQIKLKQRILLLTKIVISFLCGCDVSYFFIFFFFFFPNRLGVGAHVWSFGWLEFGQHTPLSPVATHETWLCPFEAIGWRLFCTQRVVLHMCVHHILKN